MSTSMLLFDHLIFVFLPGKLKHDSDGAETAIYAALDPHIKGLSRGYFLAPRDKPRWPSKESRYNLALL